MTMLIKQAFEMDGMERRNDKHQMLRNAVGAGLIALSFWGLMAVDSFIEVTPV